MRSLYTLEFEVQGCVLENNNESNHFWTNLTKSQFFFNYITTDTQELVAPDILRKAAYFKVASDFKMQ